MLGPVRFDEHFLDELKSRLRPSDVIGRTVKLRKQGREYVGLSPFTKEKTPSFYVNDDKGQFFDFSSGKSGDLITFLQETERLSFNEAVERLAGEAGLSLPEADPRAAVQEKVRQGLAEWVEAAARWFEGELRRPAGREARAYLERRGLPEAEWGRFRLGFAPGGRTGLKDYLIAKGARPGELVDAGLLIAPEDGGAPYDRFRNRIIFPIADTRGRVVSFGGRALDPEARAKYLNGPDTSLFHKGHLLYGLHEARKVMAQAPADAPPVVAVVEGYMDAIACQRAGVAAVAPMGTALTEDQMEALWRFAAEPVLCFDGDNAGRRAAARAIERALPLLKPGKSFRFALVQGGKDPDEVLREHGAQALRQMLADTTAFVDALFQQERDREPLETPEQRAGLKVRLRQAAATIADKDLAQAYRDALLERFDALFRTERPAEPASPRAAPRAGLRGGRWGPRGPDPTLQPASPEAKAAAQRLTQNLQPAPAALARWAVRDPPVIDDHLEDAFLDKGFGDPALADLAKEIIRVRLDAEVLDSDALARHLASRGFSTLLTDIDRAAASSGAPFLRDDVSLGAARSQWTRGFAAMSRLAALEESIAIAKRGLGGASSGVDQLLRLKTERDALKRAIKTGTIWVEDGS